MKRNDLKTGTVFKPRRSPGQRVYEIKNRHIVSYIPYMRKVTLVQEGQLKDSGSNKGFTVTNTIMGHEVGVFLLFSDFETVESQTVKIR